MSHTWCYDENSTSGPSKWCHHFANAGGHKQSPIDIKPSEAKFDETLSGEEFKLDYDPKEIASIINNGHTFQLTTRDGAKSSLETWAGVTKGHLTEKYIVVQAHFHWGTDDHNGSEHTVAGKGYAAELHIVHRNSKYDASEAANHHDGLAVLGVFLEAKPNANNAALDELATYLEKVQYKFTSVEIPNGFDLKKLLPHSMDFWTYDGSLTTPPCTECVRWTVFREPIAISHDQLRSFRSLYAVSAADCETNPQHICNNVRPCQSCHDRVVQASFKQ